MEKKIYYFIITFTLLLVVAKPLVAYSPLVKNYSATSYNAASQNWTIKQGHDKKIYIGNHYGLLEFDGYNWKTYYPGKRTTIRSIYMGDDNNVYVGFNEGFGYFKKNEFGELEYTSLSHKLDYRDLENREIWSIEKIDNYIVFQSFGGYYVVDAAENVRFFQSQTQLQLCQKVNGKTYLPSYGDIYTMENCNLTGRISLNNNFNIKAITAFEKKDDLLVITALDGMWKYRGNQFLKWDTAIDDELKWATPNRAILSQDSLVLIGTILNGLYALNLDGSLAWHLNNQNGLQNNTILAIEEDAFGNIWLALDNGISVVHNTKLLEVNTWHNKDVGAIYDVSSFNNSMYIATNQGLFEIIEQGKKGSDKTSNIVELIPHTEGYILDLYKIDDNNLLLGHSDGALILDSKNKITKLPAPAGGGMCTKPYEIDGVEHLILSSYTSFNMYNKVNGHWVLKNSIDNFVNPIQYFEVGENETIWAAHTNRGLFKLKVDKKFTTVTATNYYPSLDARETAKIGVFVIKNRIVFTDGNKCYTYDDLNDKIVPYNLLNDNIGHFVKSHRIVKVDREKYWFITENDAALISLENDTPKIINAIVYKDYDFSTLDDFENIAAINADYSLLCYNNGIAKIFHTETTSLNDAPLLIAWATAYNTKDGEDSIKLLLNAEGEIKIPYSYNNLQVGVSLPIYEKRHHFRYFLKGLDGQEQKSSKAFIDYMRLPYGSYTLVVEAIDDKEEVVGTTTYSFIIEPPFYASILAYIVYALLFIFAIYLLLLVGKRKELNARKELQLRQQKKIIKLENEKLAGENTFKSKELASYAMSMIRQTEILMAMKKELEQQKEQLGTQYPNKYYNKLMSIIENNISSKQEWEVFQSNFDRIHEYFFRNLRKKYPELTSSDLKLCALLRLNLDNKEIANLMNISIRAIETRRYRMRRKLNLESHENLTEFLIDFKS